MDSAALLERLVAFPTVSSVSNLDFIDFAEAWLTERGWRAMRIPDAASTKANLFATIGPDTGGGILLSGHTDVVPVEGQAWTSDPFRVVRRGDRLFGRGTADMKGFIACALHAGDLVAGRKLARPLHLALSYDEEVGCIGVRPMIAQLVERGIRPELAIVGEPTSMKVATGHKSKRALHAVCCGRAAHSALAPKGLNAIHLATDMVGHLRKRQQAIAASNDTESGFEVPYTTIHVGRIAGGVALNIVPDHCTLDFEIRSIARDDPDAMVKDIATDAAELTAVARRHAPEADIRIEVVWGYPGLATPANSAAVRWLTGIVGDNSLIKVDFGTEGGLFHDALGVPVLVCGPGSMDQGHRPDEFVSLDQLARCDSMMEGVIDSLAA